MLTQQFGTSVWSAPWRSYDHLLEQKKLTFFQFTRSQSRCSYYFDHVHRPRHGTGSKTGSKFAFILKEIWNVACSRHAWKIPRPCSPTLWDRLGQVGLGQVPSWAKGLSCDKDRPLAWVYDLSMGQGQVSFDLSQSQWDRFGVGNLPVPLGQAQPVPICLLHWDRLCLSQWDHQKNTGQHTYNLIHVIYVIWGLKLHIYVVYFLCEHNRTFNYLNLIYMTFYL